MLLAAGLNHGHRSEIGWNSIGFECLNVHFYEAHKWAAKIRPIATAAIDEHADGRNDPAVIAHDIDGLLDSSAARHDVLCDDEVLGALDLETAAQHQTARILLDKDVAFA